VISIKETNSIWKSLRENGLERKKEKSLSLKKEEENSRKITMNSFKLSSVS
jgi:hypothetical protein